MKELIIWAQNFFKIEEDRMTEEFLFTPRKDKIVKEYTCSLNSMCHNHNSKDVCHIEVEKADHFDFNKDTILIIDDNEGMISFLKDDLDYITDLPCCSSVKALNLLAISGRDAAFNFDKICNEVGDLRIKYAIIDITYGGTRITPSGIIKNTGVDVFEKIYANNKDFKFIFYTGNNLNPYIKANKKLIEQFYNLTGKDIKDFVLFKTSLDMDNRRTYIKDKLFT